MVDHALLVSIGVCREMKQFRINFRGQQEVVHALESALQERRNQKLIDVGANLAAFDTHLHKRSSSHRVLATHKVRDTFLEVEVRSVIPEQDDAIGNSVFVQKLRGGQQAMPHHSDDL